jgi:hypothetical protein
MKANWVSLYLYLLEIVDLLGAILYDFRILYGELFALGVETQFPADKCHFMNFQFQFFFNLFLDQKSGPF